MPRGLSLSDPANSFCPSCKNRLTFLDLIPLLSWVFLGAKCRHCGLRIPPRYFVVELITATLFGMIWYQQMVAGDDWVRGVAFMLFAAALVAAIFTDLAHYIIPDQINAFMLAAGLGMNGALIAQGSPDAWMWGMPSSVAGALVGIGVIWGVAFFGRLLFQKDAMGHGDIKMARGIGAVLLPTAALISFGLAIFLGAVLGVLIIVLRRGKEPEAASVQAEEGAEGAPAEGAEEDLPPESIPSLLWCGLGYVLCIDVFGLFFPKLYEWWFAENPYSVEEIEDDPRVELTMIPFGPYLAAGALGAMLWGPQLQGLVQAYWRSVAGG